MQIIKLGSLARIARLGRTSGFAVICAVALLLGPGCAEEDDTPKTLEMPGTIQKIDLQKRTVEVMIYSEKQKAEMPVTIELTEETEVMINGVLAKFEDVRTGETAEGTVLVEKRDGKRHFVATRVKIERAETLTAPGADGKTDSPTTNSSSNGE